MTDPVRLPDGDPLVDALRLWRRAAAAKIRAPPWRVLPNATLLAIAKQRPLSRDALAEIDGMGPARMRRHAAAVLRIVAAGRNRRAR